MEVTSKGTIPAKTLTALCKQLKKECEGNFALFAYVNDAGGSNIQANEQVAQEHINIFFPKLKPSIYSRVTVKDSFSRFKLAR